MKKLSLRLYEKLTYKERLSAFLEALAREDHEECERLVRTCPRKTYSMVDADFGDLVDGTRDIAIAFTILWLDARNRYLTVEAAAKAYLDAVAFFIKGYVQGANNTWRQAGKEGVPFDVEGREPTDEELEEIGLAGAAVSFPEEVSKVLREKANELKALWQGFAAFCGDEGLDPEKVLAWWPPVLKEVWEECELLEKPAPEEDVQTARRFFATVWERMAG